MVCGVCAKRLEKGRFSWPLESSEQGRVRLTHEELALLLGGIELCQTQRKKWYRKEELISNKVEKKLVFNTIFWLVIIPS